jgi:hypothetical protein
MAWGSEGPVIPYHSMYCGRSNAHLGVGDPEGEGEFCLLVTEMGVEPGSRAELINTLHWRCHGPPRFPNF